MPDLIKDFEHRSNDIDKFLLYFLTGREDESCMESWTEKPTYKAIISPEFKHSMPDFDMKYLSSKPDDLDYSNVDEE